MSPIDKLVAPRITDRTEFVFREVRSEAELRAVLALRYGVYSGAPGVAHFTSLDHASGLDMDAYDFVSHHIALFARTDGREQVVGTLRITGTQPGPMVGELLGIAAGNPGLEARLMAPRPAPLPMLSYLVQAPAVLSEYEAGVERGERVAEPGRLTVHPALRVAAARTGLRLSHFLITGALAMGWHVLRLDRVFLDCDVHNEPLYRRFGFLPVPGGEATYQPALGFTMSVSTATPADLPAALRPEVERIARQLATSGEATLAANAAPARRRDPRPAALPAPPAAWAPAAA